MRPKPDSCAGCPAREIGRGYVPGEGNPAARIALVGQGPGQAEAATGHPFVGPSGNLLNRWLDNAGIARAECWVDNAIRCWLPDRRGPTPAELRFCKNAHLAPALAKLPNLRVIAAIGMPAARTLLGKVTEKVVGAAHEVTL